MPGSVDDPRLLRFGAFEVDRRAHELRKRGARVHLAQQPFQVLLLLLEHAGEVVTREELRGKLWPSSVFVDFDHGLNNAIARLREALGDSAAAPHFIETVPKVGYRFIYPLTSPSTSTTVALRSDTAATTTRSSTEAQSAAGARRSRGWPVVAGALTAALLAGVLAVLWQASRAPDPSIGDTGDAALPEIPSVAVLPFANLSPDVENEFFADGLAEELASRLAGIQGLKVAAQTAAFQFKGRHEAPSVIAKALNVNHLLEGSVRRSGTRVRVTAQLIDAASGHHRWAETFDRELTDIFRIQEEIGLAVAGALQLELVEADDRRLRKHMTRDIEAYRLYLVARAQIAWVFGPPDWNVMKQSLEAAIARDPGFAAAHALLAHYYFNRTDDLEEDIRRGRLAAERAVALDPELSEALGARANFEGWEYRQQGHFDARLRAHADFRRALELDPANSQASFHYARAMFWAEPALALGMYERTLRLDPIRYSAEGQAALLLSRDGRHDEARKRVRALYDRNPGQRFHNAINIAALSYHLGQLDEALVYLREAMPRAHWELPILLWGLEMSLGDRQAASATLRDVQGSGATVALAEAARLCMEDRFDEAFDALESRRAEYPTSRVLDVPAARLALIVSRPADAAAILEQRLPDLVAGAEPIDARNVLPALDLAAAWIASSQEARGRELLERSVAFLDGPDAPRWPLFIYLRARAHALAGEVPLAQQALERAFAAGFRSSWALDVMPQSFLYIDPVRVDPAFAALHDTPGYRQWLEGIAADNGRRLARVAQRDAGNAASRNAGEAGHGG